jgi:hypothetical protein
MTRRGLAATLTLGLAWTLWVGWAAVHRFLRFEATWAVDLAAFTQLAWSGVTAQSVNLVDPMVPGQGTHLSPVLYALAPLVQSVESAVPLFWAQAFGVGLGLVAGGRLAGQALGAWVFGAIPAIVLLTCQQDFRPLILGMGSLAMAAAAYRSRGRDLPVWVVLCLMCREEYAVALLGLPILELGLKTGPRLRSVSTVAGLALAGLAARALIIPEALKRPWGESTVAQLDSGFLGIVGDMLPPWAWPFALFGPELALLAMPFIWVTANLSPETAWSWQSVGAHHHALAAVLLASSVALGAGRVFRRLDKWRPWLTWIALILTLLASTARLVHRTEEVGVVGDYLHLRAAAPLPHGLQGGIELLPEKVSVVAADSVLAALACRENLVVMGAQGVPDGWWFFGPEGRAPRGPRLWHGEGFVVVGPNAGGLERPP